MASFPNTGVFSDVNSAGASMSRSVVVQGRGLHTGHLFRLTIKPADQIGQGIMFHYVRDGVRYSAHAYWLRVSGTSRSTALILRGESRRRFELFTVEHFLAAACVSGHHDLDVEIETPDGPTESLELPVLDGSAEEWFKHLSALDEKVDEAVGRPCWKVIRSSEVIAERKRVTFSPLVESHESSLTRYHCNVDFGAAWRQSAFFEIDWNRPAKAIDEFRRVIAPARTFGFKKELEALEKRGLAKGADLSNALLLDEGQVVNEGGLRFENEIAAHKLLDAVGDFFLMGAPFLGRVDLNEAGHSMHLRAVEEAFRTGALVKGRLMADGSFKRD